jgi:hypothetical protein
LTAHRFLRKSIAMDVHPLPSAANPHPEMEALRWESAAEGYRPDYGRSLTGVFPTLFRQLGREAEGFTHLERHLPPASPRRAKRGFVLCLDGFGFNQLALADRFRSLYPHFGTWITSVFPTITSCALSSLYQGLSPARHGILGHYVWKDSPGGVVDMLKMQVDGARWPLAAAGFDVQTWKREPGILESPSSVGLPGYQLLHFSIANSGLSTYSYGKASLVGFSETLEGFTKAAKILRDLQQGWVGLYLPTIDTLSHALTGDAPQVGIAVRQIEEAVRWMVSTLPRDVADDTVFYVVADHGQNTLRTTHRWSTEQKDWLLGHARGLGFSGRAMHYYAKPGGEAEMAGWLRAAIGDRGQVCTFDEAKELAGPARDEAWVRRGLGDVVVVLRAGQNWDKEGLLKRRKEYPSELISQHGAMTWDEMFVPLLCAPLSAMLGE